MIGVANNRRFRISVVGGNPFRAGSGRGRREKGDYKLKFYRLITSGGR